MSMVIQYWENRANECTWTLAVVEYTPIGSRVYYVISIVVTLIDIE